MTLDQMFNLADKIESRECRHNSLGILSDIWCYCNTCKIRKHFNCADSIRNFAYLHENHDFGAEFHGENTVIA